MSDFKTKNKISQFLKKLKFLEQYYIFLSAQVNNKKLELYCKYKAYDLGSFRAQLISQLTVSGIQFNIKNKWASSNDMTVAKPLAKNSLDEEKIIAEILENEISFLKAFRIIVDDFMIPRSIKKMLIKQVADIRKDITYLRQVQNSY